VHCVWHVLTPIYIEHRHVLLSMHLHLISGEYKPSNVLVKSGVIASIMAILIEMMGECRGHFWFTYKFDSVFSYITVIVVQKLALFTTTMLRRS
jgi:hypothetical protein